MATLIQQELLYAIEPVGQQIMFTLENDTIVNSNYNVKFCAAVHISSDNINLSNNNDLIGTFKTTPNGVGVGMFDLQTILETFLKPDQEPRENFYAQAKYKGVWYGYKNFPIHLVDKFALSQESIMNLAINFYIEYSTSPLGVMISEIANPTASSLYRIFNGALSYDDVIDEFTISFPNLLGFDMSLYYLKPTFPSPMNQSFLTNSPTTQYASLGDYGTLPFLNIFTYSNPWALQGITVIYYDSSGVSIGSDFIDFLPGNGGAPDLSANAFTRLNYFGAFPGNLENWSTNFATAVAGGLSYYTIEATADNTSPIMGLSKIYTIKIICPNLKGYTPIRLTWLNKWGVWDYYTFNMKSIRTLNTKRIPYNQEAGTWNESKFKIKGYKGGNKNFRVNSTEKIRINTDFVTEAEGVWFEQLANSTEVYVLEGFQTDRTYSSYNTYVQPATVTNSSYTTKTIANDKLMQYTFEIEKSKMKRTQSV
jgi:hypothetical protein